MAVAAANEVQRVEVRWRGRDRLAPVGGAFLGLVLLAAAVAKSLDPHAFAEEIAALGLAGQLPPFAVAIGALGVEALLGALLIANVRRLWVMVPVTLLVGFFLFVTGRSAWRAANGIEEPAAACGCFGNLVDRTPAEAFRQDLLLLVPALALAWWARPGAKRAVRTRVGIAAGLALAVSGFAAAAPSLPLDDRATRLHPGTSLSELCAGRGAARICLLDLAPALRSGRHLVVIADAGDDGFLELGRRLNARTRAGVEPPVTVLADLTPERSDELFWSLAPAFELHETPRALLRPLYRTLPRSFRIEDGRVTATWAGLAPELTAAR